MLAELAQQEMEAILAERENSAGSRESAGPKISRKKPVPPSTAPRGGAQGGASSTSAWAAPDEGDVSVLTAEC